MINPEIAQTATRTMPILVEGGAIAAAIAVILASVGTLIEKIARIKTYNAIPQTTNGGNGGKRVACAQLFDHVFDSAAFQLHNKDQKDMLDMKKADHELIVALSHSQTKLLEQAQAQTEQSQKQTELLGELVALRRRYYRPEKRKR